MKNAPLKSARRRDAVDGMDKPPACPPRPQQNKTRRSGHMTCYQNRTTSFAIDGTLNARLHEMGPHRAFGDLQFQGAVGRAIVVS